MSYFAFFLDLHQAHSFKAHCTNIWKFQLLLLKVLVLLYFLSNASLISKHKMPPIPFLNIIRNISLSLFKILAPAVSHHIFLNHLVSNNGNSTISSWTLCSFPFCSHENTQRNAVRFECFPLFWDFEILCVPSSDLLQVHNQVQRFVSTGSVQKGVTDEPVDY